MTSVKGFSAVNGILADLPTQFSYGLFGFRLGFVGQIGPFSCFRSLSDIPEV